MNVLLSPQPPVFPHHHENPRLSPQRSGESIHSPCRFLLPKPRAHRPSPPFNLGTNTLIVSPLQNMTNRKRKADDDGDESMGASPSISNRPLARASKKSRPTTNDAVGRPLTLPRLLETLDTTQLRTVLERICEAHPDIGREVVTQAPAPTAEAALKVLQDYQDKLKEAVPYGNTSPDYMYHRIKDALVALLQAMGDFTPQFLPPIETQPTRSLQYLDGATDFIHELPDWEPQAYRHHKENAYEDVSKAWALVIDEASKRAGGFNLHTDGWEGKLNRHNERSGGRLGLAVNAMREKIGWVGANAAANNQNSILDQLMNGSYGSPVRVGPW